MSLLLLLREPVGGWPVFYAVLGDSSVYPTLRLEWAPTTSPFAETQVWEDITGRLREWEWGAGRDDELGQFEPGTGYLILDNRDRALDPSYTAGPWFGNIKTHRMFRLRDSWLGTIRDRFVAHARSYLQSYPGGVDKVVRVDLTDDLAFLQAVDLNALGFNRPAERSDERLNALLDEADIPASRRDLATGTVTVGAITAPLTTLAPDDPDSTGTALEQAKKTTDSEFRPLYVSRGGTFKAL